MAFDVSKTLGVIKGGLLNAEETWNSYLEENPSWQQTATLLTGPLLIANVLLSLIFTRMVGGYSAFGYQSGWFSGLILGLVMGAITVTISALVFSFMAGAFKGTANFSRAFAAVSLAAIPAWVAGAVSALIPYLGILLALAGGIVSLVYLYRLIPLALNVPQDKRVLHFALSLLLVFIVNVVVSAVLGLGGAFDDAGDATTAPATSGVIGELARQGELMQKAGEDVYDAPADGKLNEDQVEAYVSVLQKTRSIQEEFAQQMQKVSADMEADKEAGESFSMSDLRKAYSSVGSVMSANNAEMEVVKTGGGNWAEHEWVKQQLRIARFQQGEGSDAVAHNYALYQKYKEELNE
ncbi:MAG: Yip1 family protein [Halioglobus sp.]